MKKIITIVLCSILLLSTVGCSGNETTQTSPTAQAPASVNQVIITDEVKAELDAILQKHKYEGIVYLTQNGKVLYRSASGTNDMCDPLTMDSRMYIGSISKQFCAAAILMLRDQGKLSLEDKLEKYFPEYTIGKDITLKNLLSMESGICRDVDSMLNEPEKYENNTVEENEHLFKEYVFSQPLNFEPGTNMEYSNNNYRLLAFVVEQVSGQRYEDYIRQNIYEPLGMIHSGFKSEVNDHPEWGLISDNIPNGRVLVLAKGAGGVVTTAEDIDLWMTALQSGKVICEESFKEMCDPGDGYGYGLMASIRGGQGHTGGVGTYTSRVFFSEEYGINFFMVTGKNPLLINVTDDASLDFLKTVFSAVSNNK